MYAESADYLYVKRLDAPKAWFQENVERILSVYGQEHNIQKEDLLLGTLSLTPNLIFLILAALVISLLQAPNYALFVSHQHPEGQVSRDSS
jgi:hypothetical protein